MKLAGQPCKCELVFPDTCVLAESLGKKLSMIVMKPLMNTYWPSNCISADTANHKIVI